MSLSGYWLTECEAGPGVQRLHRLLGINKTDGQLLEVSRRPRQLHTSAVIDLSTGRARVIIAQSRDDAAIVLGENETAAAAAL